MQEAADAVKDVTTSEEATEGLGIVCMEPITAEFEIMLSVNQREAVPKLRAPDGLVYVGLKKERVAETESGAKSHRGIGRDIRLSCRTGPNFTLIAKVCFI